MTNIPDIKILPTSNLFLHEETDPVRVSRLREKIVSDGVFLNPVIVSSIGENKYAVLDGANRVTALKNLHIPHILAQEVIYKEPNVVLRTWNHAVCDEKFRGICNYSIKNFDKTEIKEMVAFVKKYKGVFKFHRVSDEKFDQVKKVYPDLVCLAVFPQFTPDDIKSFSLSNEKIPSGITRHTVNGRALRVNVSIELLKNDDNLDNKNAWLKRFISDKIINNQVRLYEESVYLFDE